MEEDECNGEEARGSNEPGFGLEPGGNHIWYTAETLDDEIQLSEQGRANLERILGNLDTAKQNESGKWEAARVCDYNSLLDGQGDHAMDEG